MTNKRMIIVGRIAMVALVLAASSASASVIYTFSGIITASDASGSAPTDAVLKGDAFEGRLVYTPAYLYLGSPGPRLHSSFVMEATFSNGIASWGSRFGAYNSEFRTHNFNGNSGLGGYNLLSGRLEAPGVPPAVGHDDGAAMFTIPDVVPWPEDLSSDSEWVQLPVELDLDRFNGGEFHWNFLFPNLYGNEGHLFLKGSIDRLVKVSVPEPSPLALLAMGLMLLLLPMAKRT